MRRHARFPIFPTAVLMLLPLIAVAADAGPPVAPVRPVITTYFGTAVTDNYRYMENLKDPEVQAWMKAQNDYTHQVIAHIPGRAALAKQLEALLGGDLRRGDFQRRGERLFYEVLQPGAQLAKLAWRDGVRGKEHILVDPAKLAKDSAHHYALDWYAPSWDGRYVAYGVSEGGSENSVLHVREVANGRELTESIDRTEDCVVAWRPDNRSFFYLRYPKTTPQTPPSQTMYNAVTYVHVLGRNAHGDGDTAVFGRGVSTSVEVPEGQGSYIVLSPDSRYAVAVANHNMDNNPNTFYVAPLDQVQGADTPWQRIATPDDGVTDVEPHGERLYVLTEKGASRFRLLSIAADHPQLDQAEVVVPEGAGVLDSFAPAGDALYLAVRAGASFQLQRVGYDGQGLTTIALPFSGTVAELCVDPRHAGVLFNLQGWLHSPREISYEPGTEARRGANTGAAADAGVARDTGLIPPSKTESDAFEAREEFAVSYDGTRIPISILTQKGAVRDGSHPALVFGYGSYGISMDPSYNASRLAWLEHGGVFAIVHIRGGGEYGDAWHRAGQKLWKINSILDFDAGAQYLIDRHYTQSKYLVANSASAGGIIMGGAITLDPGLFRVVLDDVGISDALRSETEPNGPPNVPEMGSTSQEQGFHALYSMSGYAHVHDGTPYPAVMCTTGANDPRVASWQMLKMAARLQAATSSGRPVLLRIDYDAGHGFGSSVLQRVNLLADEWSFAFWQLGLRDFQPGDSR
ncbi:MAG TPA: prolyl oligopeptidase family serine peptidase [Steroidobacteraceae bacterium]|nr:prolyl oligopeptidase family serine peptidase [Steroidobacteraceae bacterium]